MKCIYNRINSQQIKTLHLNAMLSLLSFQHFKWEQTLFFVYKLKYSINLNLKKKPQSKAMLCEEAGYMNFQNILYQSKKYVNIVIFDRCANQFGGNNNNNIEDPWFCVRNPNFSSPIVPIFVHLLKFPGSIMKNALVFLEIFGHQMPSILSGFLYRYSIDSAVVCWSFFERFNFF
eukprot:TRINITY_DN5291_c1_g1_i1.p1 TRINITY_DN5291_c1_g1~~TRINITY_DN5291_c1_g1_i1.p1  ORF type:complete len:175 (-),score=1.23 TRINITY_DN5291_c1_g1_i1:126-650(-)